MMWTALAPAPPTKWRRDPTKDLLDKVDLRLADTIDAPVLAKLLGEYMNSTDWKGFIKYDERLASTYLRNVIDFGIVPHILACEKKGGAVIGILSYELVQDFSEEPIAIAQNLWVHEKYRRGPLGRLLVAMLITLATDEGASVMHFPVMSHLPEANSLKNLLAKAGFHELGYVMRRKLDHGR